MSTVQAVRDPQDAAQLCNQPPLFPGHPGEIGVSLLGKRAPVVSGYVRNHLDLLRGEGREVAVHDQMIGVLVVLGMADEIADVVE